VIERDRRLRPAIENTHARKTRDPIHPLQRGEPAIWMQPVGPVGMFIIESGNRDASDVMATRTSGIPI
jgi:hypothetical protein